LLTHGCNLLRDLNVSQRRWSDTRLPEATGRLTGVTALGYRGYHLCPWQY
jgi:hypothetical protein